MFCAIEMMVDGQADNLQVEANEQLMGGHHVRHAHSCVHSPLSLWANHQFAFCAVLRTVHHHLSTIVNTREAKSLSLDSSPIVSPFASVTTGFTVLCFSKD